MKLRELTKLDAIAELLARKKGQCRYCNIAHSVGQCQQPRNWSNSAPARLDSRAVWEANELGSQERYLKQLEREQQREFIRSIKP